MKNNFSLSTEPKISYNLISQNLINIQKNNSNFIYIYI